MSGEIVEALGSAEFATGVRWGLLATAVALPVGVVWRSRAGKAAPLHGVLVAAAFLGAIPVVRPIGRGLWLVLFLLVVGGVLHGVLGQSPALATVLALPGAWLLADLADLPGDGLEWLIVLVVVFGAPLVASFDGLDPGRALGPGLWLLAVAGIFAGVPDTEEALVLLGVSAPLALLGWPVRLIHIGPGAIALLGVFMWVAVWGGRGRPYTTMAVVAALGLLLVEPVVKWLRGWAVAPSAKEALGVLALQLVIVILASRGVARFPSVAVAGLLALLVLAGGALALLAWQRMISRTDRR